MASTYSDLKIELIGTGEQSGTWGATTNTNLGTAIEEAITGSADVTFSSTDVTLTLTNTNGTQAARNLRLVCTGTSGGARNLILGSGCQIEKLYLIQNDLADTVTVKNTTGTGVAIPAGRKQFVFNNGTNVVEATSATVNLATDVTGTLPVTNGGTGQTSYTNGQLLIGNTTGNTLTKATLTGTTNRLTVTNGTGSITLNVDATNANTANKVVARDGSGNFSAGTITANLTGNVTGNAATATALQNARTIGGVSFNGTANINLPGVNTVGNQNTTGSAATLTTARTIGGVSFNGSANINLPGVNIAGNQNTTGSAASWTTARTLSIGGTGKSVNGTGNVTWTAAEITAGKLSTASGSAASYSARVWVKFDGSGTVTVNGSGNVSSVSDDATGRYTINFSTALPDANYSFQAGCSRSGTGEQGTAPTTVNGGGVDGATLTYSTSALQVQCYTANQAVSNAIDPDVVCVAIFR
jgi:hypothetical protein